MTEPKEMCPQFDKKSPSNPKSTVPSESLTTDYLHNEYGMTVTHELINTADLARDGYRPLSPEEAAQVSALFQFVPQVVTGSVKDSMTQETFKTAIKDSYRVILKPGEHLGNSHKTPGAKSAIVFNNNNKLKHTADLVKNDAQLTIPSTPDIALSFFNALSFITGQYFMAQTNSKLGALQNDLVKVKQVLTIERESDFKAYISDLEDIVTMLDTIKRHPEQISATISDIHSIQHAAKGTAFSSGTYIEQEAQTLNSADKVDSLQSKIETIGNHILNYRLATQIYVAATMIEIQLYDISDPEDLEKYYQLINRRVSEYKEHCNGYQQKLTAYLKANRSLNKISGVKYLFSSTAGTNGDWLASARNKDKEKEESIVQDYIIRFADTKAMDATCESLRRFIDRSRQPAEILLVDGTYYTNIPND